MSTVATTGQTYIPGTEPIGQPTGNPTGQPVGTNGATIGLRPRVGLPLFPDAPTITLPDEMPEGRKSDTDGTHLLVLKTKKLWFWLPQETDPGTADAIEAWQILTRIASVEIECEIKNTLTDAKQNMTLREWDESKLPTGGKYRIRLRPPSGVYGPSAVVDRRNAGQLANPASSQPVAMPGTVGVFELLMQQLNAQQQQNLELIKSLRGNNGSTGLKETLEGLAMLDGLRGGSKAAEPADPLANLVNVAEQAKKLEGLFGGGRGPRPMPGPSTGELIAKQVPTVMAGLLRLADAFVQSQKQEQPQPNTTPHRQEVVDKVPDNAQRVESTTPANRQPPPREPTVRVGNERGNVAVPGKDAEEVAKWAERIRTQLEKANLADSLTPSMVVMLAMIAHAQDTEESDLMVAARIYTIVLRDVTDEERDAIAQLLSQVRDGAGNMIIKELCFAIERDPEFATDALLALECLAFPGQVPDENADQPDPTTTTGENK